MPTDNPQTQRQPSAAARINERVEQGAQRVEQGVQSATDAAIQQVRSARERAESGLEQQRALVSGRVRRLGEALRQTSDHLTREDQIAQELLDNASARVQRVADYIDHARPEDVAQDLQSFARRQPAVFFGGAFLIGLALGRFAKSSGSHSGQMGSAEQLTASRRLPQRTESAQRAPGYDVTAATQTATATPASPPASSVVTSTPAVVTTPASGSTPASAANTISTAPGSAFGADVPVNPSTSQGAKPPAATTSTRAKATEPGQGTKS